MQVVAAEISVRFLSQLCGPGSIMWGHYKVRIPGLHRLQHMASSGKSTRAEVKVML